MPFRAILFDFDGLILDTETPERDAWKAEFDRYGVPFPLDYFLWCVGRGADQIVQRPHDLLKNAVPELEFIESVDERVNQHRLDMIYSAAPRPGIRELLEECHGKIPMAVASSSRHNWVDHHLDRLGLRAYFETTVCADDVASAKPFPDLYLEAARRIGIETDDCLALEDSENGCRAAMDAGVRVIAFPNPLTEHFTFNMATAVWRKPTAPQLDELQAIFERAQQ